MRPLGRQYYKNKTGGKHHVKVDGETTSWWGDIIPANKTADKVANKVRVEDCIDYEDDPNFIEWWDYKEYWEGLNK